MNHEITYHGIARDGVFIPDLPKLFERAYMFHQEKRITVTIDREHKTRSNPQNKYYRAVVVSMIGEAMGEEDLDEVHNILKAKFNFKEIISPETGEIEKIGKSTKKMSTVAFEEYLEKCRMWGSKFFGIYIPEPNQSNPMHQTPPPATREPLPRFRPDNGWEAQGPDLST